MVKSINVISSILFIASLVHTQDNPFDRLDFILGSWQGTGSGFGNETSQIEANYTLVMDGKYIKIINESFFKPTEKKPDGEHHIDRGFISFDTYRNVIVFRQFNNEGYINQYVLIDSWSNANSLVFESEIIENFAPGGKARWTINKLTERQIETVFDVSFPGGKYSCFGKNIMEIVN